jgi:glycosyltransferase involved in cell wall biosynthesis
MATTVAMTMDIVLRGQPAFLSRDFDVTLISSPEPRLDEVGRREGVPTVGLPMTREITPLRDAAAIVRMWRLARRGRPDVVHSYTPKAGLVVMVGARLAGVPHRIHSVVGLPLTESRGLKHRVLKAVESVTYRNATTVLANSEELAAHLGGLFPRQEFGVVAEGTVDGIDGARFDPSLPYPDVRAALGIPADAVVFAYVGRVVRHKGIRELVAALLEVRADHPEAHLVVVGEVDGAGGPPDDVQETMRTDPGIHWVGFQSDVRPYLAAADVLCLPSYREGLPQSVLEAAAMEVPAIVTDISGCREAVIPDMTGWLIPVKDAGAVRDAMLHAMTQAGALPDMGRKARPFVLGRFEQQHVRTALVDLYRAQTADAVTRPAH